jgi:hypothetical protein
MGNDEARWRKLGLEGSMKSGDVFVEKEQKTGGK